MKRTLTFTLLLAALFLSLPSSGEGIRAVEPERVGLSSDRLERIGATMQGYVDDGSIVGAVGMIARNGEVAYVDSWGNRSRETGDQMTTDTIFRIYSMSKPITSVALMMLYEEGRFLLEDPVGNYLPDLAGLEVAVLPEGDDTPAAFNLPDPEGETSRQAPPPNPVVKTVPAKHDMTIQDLMRHTSGLAYGFFSNSAVDKMYMRAGILVEDKNIEETVANLGKIPLKHQPGTTYEYSVSVDVQGRLIEVLSGVPLDKYFEQRIFLPLGMFDTGFAVPDEKLGRFAEMYTPDGNGGIEPSDPQFSRNFVGAPTLFSGGGGLVSTAGDYLRFCQMLLNGGQLDGVRLLSRKTIELMTADHVAHIRNGRRDSGYGFGLGFAVAQDLSRIGIPTSIGEYNWGGAAGTKFWIDPQEEMIGVYMVQILPHTGLTYGKEFKIQAYQSIID